MCWCPAHTTPTLTIPEHKDVNTCNSLSTWETYFILGTGQVGAPENWHAGNINQSVMQENKSKLCSMVFPRGPSRMEPHSNLLINMPYIGFLLFLVLLFHSLAPLPWNIPHKPHGHKSLSLGLLLGKVDTRMGHWWDRWDSPHYW